MPRADPTPSPRLSTLRRFRQILRLLAVTAVAIAAVAILLAIRGAGPDRTSLMVAAALGVGIMVLFGTALMTLGFLRSSTQHGRAAEHQHHEDDE